MRVDPSLLEHPKYLQLRATVGDYALEALIRMWAHCQLGQRGEVWLGRDGTYVELVCRWSGPPGGLFSALKRLKWVHQERRAIRIHGWNEFNSNAIASWNNAKGPRKPRKSRGKATVNPGINQGQAPDDPQSIQPSLQVNTPNGVLPFSEVHKEGDSSIPTKEEWFASATMAGVPAWMAEFEWEKLARDQWRLRSGRYLTRAGVRHHAAIVAKTWRARGSPMTMSAWLGRGEKNGAAADDLKDRLERLRQEAVGLEGEALKANLEARRALTTLLEAAQ